MTNGIFGRLVMRGGLTLAAAFMMTTAVFGQDQAQTGGEDPTETVDASPGDEGSQTGQEPNPEDHGIAEGEPDPNAGDGPDIVIDDGYEIGGWPDDSFDDGSDGGGDWVDDGSDGGTDDGWVDDGTGDGTDDGWVDDGTGDGTDDGWVDDGSGGSVGDDGLVDDGEVTIHYLDGGPVLCADCDGDFGDLPVEAYQMSAGNPLADAAAAGLADAPVAAKPRRNKSQALAVGNMANCLAEHPQLPWICEWQNGAGQ